MSSVPIIFTPNLLIIGNVDQKHIDMAIENNLNLDAQDFSYGRINFNHELLLTTNNIKNPLIELLISKNILKLINDTSKFY